MKDIRRRGHPGQRAVDRRRRSAALDEGSRGCPDIPEGATVARWLRLGEASKALPPLLEGVIHPRASREWWTFLVRPPSGVDEPGACRYVEKSHPLNGMLKSAQPIACPGQSPAAFEWVGTVESVHVLSPRALWTSCA